MGGREGLVDTAVKTAETGYMARRLMKVRYVGFNNIPLTTIRKNFVKVQVVVFRRWKTYLYSMITQSEIVKTRLCNSFMEMII